MLLLSLVVLVEFKITKEIIFHTTDAERNSELFSCS